MNDALVKELRHSVAVAESLGSAILGRILTDAAEALSTTLPEPQGVDASLIAELVAVDAGICEHGIKQFSALFISGLLQRAASALRRTVPAVLETHPTHAIEESVGKCSRCGLGGDAIYKPCPSISDGEMYKRHPNIPLEPQGVSDLLSLAKQVREIPTHCIMSTKDQEVLMLACEALRRLPAAVGEDYAMVSRERYNELIECFGREQAAVSEGEMREIALNIARKAQEIGKCGCCHAMGAETVAYLITSAFGQALQRRIAPKMIHQDAGTNSPNARYIEEEMR